MKKVFVSLAAIGTTFASFSALASTAESPPEAPATDTTESGSGDKANSLGARFRYVTIPKFVIGLFAEGGASVDGFMGGVEYGMRRGSFEAVFAASFGAYSMSQAPFKSKGEIIEGWELISVDMKALYLTSSFLWSTPFSKSDPTFQFLYGGETGLGFVFGKIIRNQAMPADPNSRLDPTETPWVPCPAIGSHPYCGDENDHYGDYSEPSWFNGGAKPVILPWLSFNTGLLIRPSESFSARIDLGYNLFNGPFIGASGSFGL